MVGSVALFVGLLAIPMSFLEARARDAGHGRFAASVISLLAIASWPGYFLGVRLFCREEPSVRGMRSGS
jgi:hypothetical protein